MIMTQRNDIVGIIKKKKTDEPFWLIDWLIDWLKELEHLKRQTAKLQHKLIINGPLSSDGVETNKNILGERWWIENVNPLIIYWLYAHKYLLGHVIF